MKIRSLLLAVITTATLSACVAPIDDGGSVVVGVPVGVPVPVLVKENSDSIHVCKITAFTDTYRAENHSRGKARLDALKQCQADHDEMFCRDKDVKCTQYQ